MSVSVSRRPASPRFISEITSQLSTWRFAKGLTPHERSMVDEHYQRQASVTEVARLIVQNRIHEFNRINKKG